MSTNFAYPSTGVVKPLRGDEITSSLVEAFRRMLVGDDRLAPHLAYASFSYRIHVTIHTPGGAQSMFTRELDTLGGPITGEPEEDWIDLNSESDLLSPNAARIDAELPVPVTVTDEYGHEREEEVKYTPHPKRGPRSPRAPKSYGV